MIKRRFHQTLFAVLIVGLVLVIGVPVLAADNGNFLWAESLGGNGDDVGWSITTDGLDRIYVTGVFNGTAAFGASSLTSSGSGDIFVSRMDPAGSAIWSRRMGGGNYDGGSDITVDALGNIYVTGYFQQTADFGSTNLTSAGSGDIFVLKLNSAGNILWAKRMGGNSNDEGFGIASDPTGNVYVTGYFHGTADFGAFSLTSQGMADVFIAKLDGAGNVLWVKQIRSDQSEIAYGIAVDSSGNVYITGNFTGSAVFGPFTLLSLIGSQDVFVSKLDSAGNFIWAKRMGGIDDDGGNSIVVDAAGNVYLTGAFADTADFGAVNLTAAGNFDIFAAKLDGSGNVLWAKSLGGTSADIAVDLAVDPGGNTYLTGYFRDVANFGTFSLTSAGAEDIYVSSMDAAGNVLWARRMGGANYEIGNGVAADQAGNIYATGYYQDSADFGTFTLTSVGNLDVFVTKLGLVAPPAPTQPATSTPAVLPPAPVQPAASAPVSLPGTGFAPGKVTELSPGLIPYTDPGDLWLEIPRLNVQAPIVGVPLSAKGSWDVSWLWKDVGWLGGTAFPTWEGNSVLTGHVYDQFGMAGPFVHLNWLWYGDQVVIHAWGTEYVYEVRQTAQVLPGEVASALKHEELPWVTLITCRGYDPSSDSYKYRVIVRAVLVEVK